MKYLLAVFDMDGTILDTLDDLTNTLTLSLEEEGMPPRTRDEVRSFVGNGVGKLIERALPEDTTAEEREKFFEVFARNYKLHCADLTRPYDGVPELIAALRERGVKTAVVSNKVDFAVRQLAEDYFPGLFDIAVGEREGVRRKPAPDSVNEVMRTLDIPRLNISLPIMSEWSDAKLKITPCRYAGTAYKSGFVIAGHNYRRHFGPLGRIAPGDRVTFTDVDGNVFAYDVAEIQVLKPAAIEDMVSQEWDLSLFTCTLGGQTRLTVRCEACEE